MDERVADYFLMGVGCIWVINPWSRRAFSEHADGSRSRKNKVLRVTGTEIAVSMVEMFAKPDRMQGIVSE